MHHNILLISQHRNKHDFLENLLKELGHRVNSSFSYSNYSVLNKMNSVKPSLVVIYEMMPQRSLLNVFRRIQDQLPTPIIVFADKSENDFIKEAITAGASSFIVDGIEKHRISRIIEASTARFEKCQAIKKKLIETERKLEERREIEKAKGVLMSTKGITEDEAYSLLRSKAMSKNLRIGDLAKNINAASDLLN